MISTQSARLSSSRPFGQGRCISPPVVRRPVFIQIRRPASTLADMLASPVLVDDRRALGPSMTVVTSARRVQRATRDGGCARQVLQNFVCQFADRFPLHASFLLVADRKRMSGEFSSEQKVFAGSANE